MSYLTNKRVVVTGAGGSIGSQICLQAQAEGAAALVLVSLTESGLYDIDQRLRAVKAHRSELTGILGSVTDVLLMRRACKDADIVIHAAAHKHLPICENNPVAAVENNAFGTKVMVSAAQEMKCADFVLISTDKAVHPSSVMGATKRLAELLVAYEARRSQKIRLLTVRFGNVLHSAGSVLPLWAAQIAAGGPLTLTDAGCERYFMSIPQAVELIFGTLAGTNKSGCYVFDMGPPKRLLDYANQMIADSGKTIAINFTGLRPGEKLTEELHHGGDLIPTDNPKIFRVDDTTRCPSLLSLLQLREYARQRDDVITREQLWKLFGDNA